MTFFFLIVLDINAKERRRRFRTGYHMPCIYSEHIFILMLPKESLPFIGYNNKSDCVFRTPYFQDILTSLLDSSAISITPRGLLPSIELVNRLLSCK